MARIGSVSLLANSVRYKINIISDRSGGQFALSMMRYLDCVFAIDSHIK